MPRGVGPKPPPRRRNSSHEISKRTRQGKRLTRGVTSTCPDVRKAHIFGRLSVSLLGRHQRGLTWWAWRAGRPPTRPRLPGGNEWRGVGVARHLELTMGGMTYGSADHPRDKSSSTSYWHYHVALTSFSALCGPGNVSGISSSSDVTPPSPASATRSNERAISLSLNQLLGLFIW